MTNMMSLLGEEFTQQHIKILNDNLTDEAEEAAEEHRSVLGQLGFLPEQIDAIVEGIRRR